MKQVYDKINVRGGMVGAICKILPSDQKVTISIPGSAEIKIFVRPLSHLR